MRSSIVANMASALTAQKAFLNNFDNIVNHGVDIWEDIRHYQDTLCYASSKVDYSMGENIYMLPSIRNMNLKIKTRTVGYNNKILISDSKFNLGKNDKVNTLEPTKTLKVAIKSHKVIVQSTATQASPNLARKPTITHKEEKAASILFLTGAFTLWYMFH